MDSMDHVDVDEQKRGVIFDGDDTLWVTESLYDDARSAARFAVNQSSEIGAQWEHLQRQIDVANVAIFGFSPNRFPTSCVQAYQQLCRDRGLAYDPSVAVQIRNAAQQVFDRDPELTPGVHETLNSLRAAGVRLALLTKGDPNVQQRRVSASGLVPYFDVVRIVTEKSPDTIREVTAQLGVSLPNTWMVGNSVRSDVLPALAAGVRAIWFRAHVWEYERAHDHLLDDRALVISQLSELPKAIVTEAAVATTHEDR
jgi:putative hydrolase of the HAD superfamily